VSNLWNVKEYPQSQPIKVPGDTVTAIFWNAVKQRNTKMWLRQKKLGLWRGWTWQDAGTAVGEIANGLLGLGFAWWRLRQGTLSPGFFLGAQTFWYFVVGVWAHVNAITLVGLGRVWAAAAILCVEAAVSSVGAVLLITRFGGTGVILSLMVATSLVSGILLPLAVRRWWPDSATTAGTQVVGDDSVLSR